MNAGILIIGCGKVGSRLAQGWIQAAVPVWALARSGDSAKNLQSLGVQVIRGDLDDAGELLALADLPLENMTLYYLAPPPGEGEGDPRMLHFLQALEQGNVPEQIIYMGTSGVYGDSAGEWVDEQSPLHPETSRARRRLAAEQALRAGATRLGFSLTLLRVGGIYGPGRLPEARLRKGLPVLRESECGYSNRIHLDDLLTICVACAEQPAEGVRVFNVSDGRPGNMTEYFLAVADRLGLQRPPQISMAEAAEQLSPAMLSYLGESRRMDSRKVWRELGLEPRYPDLASGLAEI